MVSIFKPGSFLLLSSVYADSITDLTEIYTAEDVVHMVKGTPSDFHGLIVAGLFNNEKVIGDSGQHNVLLPIFKMTYQDWAY